MGTNEMTLYELFSNVCLNGGAIVLVLMTLIQISPIKINPWSRIAKFFSSTITADINKRIDGIEKQVKEVQANVDTKIEQVNANIGTVADSVENVRKEVEVVRNESAENNIINVRTQILRFGDEISHGMNHSRDHYQQILGHITKYNQYCQDHPKFENNITVITSERIMDEYKKRDLNNNFL